MPDSRYPEPTSTEDERAIIAVQGGVAQTRLFSNARRDPEPLTLLSDGLGQNSAALLYLLHYTPELMARYAPGRFIAMASATGSEHADTNEHTDYLKEFCKAVGIQFEHVTPGSRPPRRGLAEPRILLRERTYRFKVVSKEL